MRKKLYVLTHLGGSWEVRWGDEKQGKFFDHKDDAIKFARDSVASFYPGYCAQILVQKQGGQFQTEWTYGSDPFPPRG